MSEQEDTEVSLRIARDEEGNVKPVEGRSPQLNIKVKVLPITVEQSRRMDNWGLPCLKWTLEDKCQILKENVVEPEDFGEDLTPEELATEFEAYAVDDIVQAVAMHSGYKRFFENREDDEGKELAGLNNS